MQQLQQCALVDRELLQRLALDARHDAGDEPARQAQFDNGDQRAVRIEAAGDRLRSFNFCMGRSIGSHQQRWMQYPRRCPIASPLEAFGRRPPNTRRRLSSGRHPKPFTEADFILSKRHVCYLPMSGNPANRGRSGKRRWSTMSLRLHVLPPDTLSRQTPWGRLARAPLGLRQHGAV